MKSKLLFALIGVFALFGAAGVADLFGMADVSTFLKSQGETFKAEYRAVQAEGTLTETAVITKETTTAE